MQKIRFDELIRLPDRSDFTNQCADTKVVKGWIEENKDVLFFPNDFIEKHEFDRVQNVKKQYGKMPPSIFTYKIFTYGIIPGGTKVCVILEDIDLFIDICVKTSAHESRIRDLIIKRGVTTKLITTVLQRPLKGFYEEPTKWVRVFFYCTKERDMLIKIVNEINDKTDDKYILANDLTGPKYAPCAASYYQYNTCGWNLIKAGDYTWSRSDNKTSISGCEYIIRVPISKFKALPDNKIVKESLVRDNSMIACWDTEVYQYGKKTGEAAKPSDTNYIIFMIGLTLHWQHSNDSLIRICIMHCPVNPKKNINFNVNTQKVSTEGEQFIIIECPTKESVLLTYFDLLGKYRNELLTGFNNGSFDTPILREELLRIAKKDNTIYPNMLRICKEKFACHMEYNDNNDRIYTNTFKKEEIKISAEETLGKDKERPFISIQSPGMVDTDTMAVFKQLYPRAEVGRGSSLNYYLKLNKLEGKEDMPYMRMFAIYELFSLINPLTDCTCDKLYDDKRIIGEDRKKITSDEEDELIEIFKKIAESDREFLINGILTDRTRALTVLLLDLYRKNWGHTSGDVIDVAKCPCCHKAVIWGEMELVAKYCVIDAYRCQQLYTKRSVISERREVSNMAYVGVFDAFFRANGMKIRNLVASFCHNNGIAFPHTKPPRDLVESKFPGAWVFPPVKGLVIVNRRPRPATGLDFSSLYPSLMMAYNLSPDKIVFLEAQAKDLINKGYNLHEIDFRCEDGSRIHAWSVRHNGIHEINGSGKIFNSFKKDENGKFIKENGKRVPNRTRDSLPGESMGVFPYILQILFNKRAVVKKVMIALQLIEEKLKIDPNYVPNEKELAMAEITLDKVNLSEVQFRIAKLNAKQLALKVFMNTFYGEQGNSKSSLYVKAVAGGVTTAGQYNIKKVAEFCEANQYYVKYGDTDSVYITCPDHVYAEIDQQYDTAVLKLKADKDDNKISEEDFISSMRAITLEYWTNMVTLTQKDMNQWKEVVNDMLADDNGTEFLKMAYEEVLAPCYLMGKKKYFGIPHIDSVNFNINTIKDLFIRGIDIIKQGQTDLSRECGFEVMKKMCDIHSIGIETPPNIIKNEIEAIYTRDWDLSYFKTNGKYKPLKNNVSMHTFVRRMLDMQSQWSHNPVIAALYTPPDPGEPFEYVVVRKDQSFNLRGNKINLKKGDTMEYVRVYEQSKSTASPMEIDLDYYADNVMGVYARFLSYMPEFEPTAEIRAKFNEKNRREMDYEDDDKYIIKHAKDYVTQYRDAFIGKNKKAAQEQGKQYKEAFRNVDKIVKNSTGSQLGTYKYIITDFNLANCEKNDALNIIKAMAKSHLENYYVNRGKKLLVSMLNKDINLYSIKKYYMSRGNFSITAIKSRIYDYNEASTERKILNMMPKIVMVCNQYILNLKNLVDMARQDSNTQLKPYDFPEEYIKWFKELHILYIQYISVKKSKQQIMDFIEAITDAINEDTGGSCTKEINIKEELAKPITAKPISDYDERKGYSISELIDE